MSKGEEYYIHIALILALRNRNTKKFHTLLESGIDVNAKDSNGWTALMHASEMADPNSVQALIDKGADVNARNKRRMDAVNVRNVSESNGKERCRSC